MTAITERTNPDSWRVPRNPESQQLHVAATGPIVPPEGGSLKAHAMFATSEYLEPVASVPPAPYRRDEERLPDEGDLEEERDAIDPAYGVYNGLKYALALWWLLAIGWWGLQWMQAALR